MASTRRSSRGTPYDRLQEARARRAGERPKEPEPPEGGTEATVVSERPTSGTPKPPPRQRSGRLPRLAFGALALAVLGYIFVEGEFVVPGVDVPRPVVAETVADIAPPDIGQVSASAPRPLDLRPIYVATPLMAVAPDLALADQAVPPRLGPLPQRSLPFRQAPQRSPRPAPRPD